MTKATAKPQPAPPIKMGWLADSIASFKQRERTILIAAVGFQIVVLLGLMVIPFMTVLFGDTVYLRVVPVDPRDLIRGDYVILSYDFSSFPSQGIPGIGNGSNNGTEVYVTLVPGPDGKHWRSDRYSLEKPSSGKFIRGKITRRGQIEFGIESFFVQEGEGRKYEDAIRKRKLSAKVSIDANGNAVLRDVEID